MNSALVTPVVSGLGAACVTGLATYLARRHQTRVDAVLGEKKSVDERRERWYEDMYRELQGLRQEGTEMRDLDIKRYQQVLDLQGQVDEVNRSFQSLQAEHARMSRSLTECEARRQRLERLLREHRLLDPFGEPPRMSPEQAHDRATEE